MGGARPLRNHWRTVCILRLADGDIPSRGFRYCSRLPDCYVYRKSFYSSSDMPLIFPTVIPFRLSPYADLWHNISRPPDHYYNTFYYLRALTSSQRGALIHLLSSGSN